jgi:type I restriction enzyme, S subunit
MSASKEIKKGYKLTKVGVIPEEWKVVTLDEISTVNPSKVKGINEEELVSFIGMADVSEDAKLITHSPKPYNKVAQGFTSFKDGDILIAKITPCFENGKGALVANLENGIGFGSTEFHVLRAGEKALNKYIYFHITSYPFREKGKMNMTGSAGQKRVPKNFIGSYNIPLPPISEQQKIAAILSSWDSAIERYNRLLKHSQAKRKGLEQQLFSGEVRFKEFIKSTEKVSTKVGVLPEDWKLRTISSIVKRVKNPFKPEADKMYREIGIRSHAKGIFYKEEVTGKSLGNKSVFWIEPDCFVVNIVFAWEHAIAKTTEAEVGMIASHRFPMYKPKAEILDLDYLLYYFKTQRGKHLLGLASPGGAGRNKTLGQSDFAKLQIPVPALEEQKKIVSVLSKSDKEIELLKNHIATLKEQKKGLMQKLLTGEVRVKKN